MKQFEEFDKSTHETRLKALRARSKRGYIDDGPVALYHALLGMQAKGFTEIVEWSLTELERLYKLEDEKSK